MLKKIIETLNFMKKKYAFDNRRGMPTSSLRLLTKGTNK